MAQKVTQLQIDLISASTDGVFSILKSHFTQYQNSALHNYVQVAVMPQCKLSLLLQNHYAQGSCHYAQLCSSQE